MIFQVLALTFFLKIDKTTQIEYLKQKFTKNQTKIYRNKKLIEDKFNVNHFWGKKQCVEC